MRGHGQYKMALLEVNDLRTSFFTDAGEVKAVNGVSFNLDRGKVLGIVGESGSGKSVTAYSIMQILASTGRIVGGSIKLDGEELVGAGEGVMRRIRGNRVSIIFQDPMTSLNPTHTIGHQIMEAILLHTDRNRAEARERAVEMLRLVNINEPEKRMKQYPHELSGGMRQRVVIAMALACEPDILIADEPTTALDVTIQAQILDLINELKQKYNTAMIMITHDLGVVAQTCDNIAVVYAGKIVEYGNKEHIFIHPTHPYTLGLFGSLPNMKKKVSRLTPINGLPPNPSDLPKGCAFAPRCPHALPQCSEGDIPLVEIAPGHLCRCCLKTKEA